MPDSVLPIIGSLALVALGLFIRPYLETKGRNLATKEDTEALTQQVEQVRTLHARSLEEVRHELARRQVAFAEQYRAELEVYRELWERLVEVQKRAQQLRPMLDVGLGPDESEDDRKVKRLNDFGSAFNAFTAVVWQRRPFYPEEIHVELRKLATLIQGEAIDYRHGDPKLDSEYWRNAQASLEKIGSQIDNVCVAIRQRLVRVSAV